MLENIDYKLVIASIVGLVFLLFICVVLVCCIRRLCPSKYRKAPIIDRVDKENVLSSGKKSAVGNGGVGGLDGAVIINVSEEDGTEKLFGLSLNDIPFIDDSKYSSHIDLSRNPYQPLTNTA